MASAKSNFVSDSSVYLDRQCIGVLFEFSDEVVIERNNSSVWLQSYCSLTLVGQSVQVDFQGMY